MSAWADCSRTTRTSCSPIARRVGVRARRQPDRDGAAGSELEHGGLGRRVRRDLLLRAHALMGGAGWANMTRMSIGRSSGRWRRLAALLLAGCGGSGAEDTT